MRSPNEPVPVPPPVPQKPDSLQPDDMRAKIQLLASLALDIAEWQMRNYQNDPKTAQQAYQDILDRAGYQAPAKAKGGEGLLTPGSGGGLVPSVEDQVRELSDAFTEMKAGEQE